jgi:hypothetical protein
LVGLRGVGDPVFIHVHTFSRLFLIFGSLSDFSSIGSSFSDEVVGLGSSDFTPETHVGGGSLLSEGSKRLLNNEASVFAKADTSPGI